MIRSWLMSLSCLSLFCITLVVAMQSYGQVRQTRDYIRHLENTKAALERLDIEHQEAQKKMMLWNQLWERTVEAGLKPEQWEEYPVNIDDVFLLHEADGVMRLLSNNIIKEQNFWFAPGFIQVNPVILTNESQQQKRSAVKMRIQGKIMTMVQE